MLLKKLSLHNFRQYKGDQEIEFSIDPKQNMTLITGENSQGKTTLVQAFRWLLYEDSDFKKKGVKSSLLLNAEVASSMRKGDKESVLVELTLLYSGHEYIISREHKYYSSESGIARAESSSIFNVRMKNNGIIEWVDNERERIQTMFPKGLINYLFFDGEKDITSGENVQKAVDSIMGLDILRSMMTHMDSAQKSLLKKRTCEPNSEARVASLRRENENLEKENTALNEAIGLLDAEVISFDSEISRYKQIQQENKDSLDLAKKRDDLEMQISAIESEINLDLKTLAVRESDALLKLQVYPLIKKVLAILSAGDYDNKGIPNMNVDTLKYILEHGVCICGKELKDDPEAIAHLQQLFDYLPPKSIGTMINEMQTFLKKESQNASSVVSNIQSDYKVYYTNKIDRLRFAKAEYLQVSDNLKGVSPENVQDKLTSAMESKRSRESQITGKKAEIKSNDKTIAENNRLIEQYCKNDEANQAINLRLKYVEMLGNRAARNYQKQSEENRAEFKDEIQKTFDSMFRARGERFVQVDRNYNVTIPLIKYSNLDTSEGTDVVKNFAFVATLLKMAKDHAKSDDGIIGSEPMPLVMDAPFSKLDATHIRNISEKLPNLAHQTIVTMLEHQWRNAEIQSGKYVGKRYTLVSHTQTYTEIKEVIQ